MDSKEVTLSSLQADVAECRRLFQHGGVAELTPFIIKKAGEWKRLHLNIAIIGFSGVGKSSFINAIRDLTADDEGAAPVNVNEETRTIDCYSHPDYQLIKFWDLPGVGTPQFPKDKYLELIHVDRYDFFLLFSEKSFIEIDNWLATSISQRGKKFYFVRTKVGPTHTGTNRYCSVTDEAELKQLRQNIDKNIKAFGQVKDAKVFLIDNYQTDQYDFHLLKSSLVEDIPELKNIALMMSMAQCDEQAQQAEQREKRRTEKQNEDTRKTVEKQAQQAKQNEERRSTEMQNEVTQKTACIIS